MEDVRIGRKASYQAQSFTATGAGLTLVVRANPKRLALTFSSSAVAAQFYGPKVLPISAAVGLAIQAEAGLHQFDLPTHGLVVTDEWNWFDPAAGSTFTVIETLLEDTQ